MEIEGGMPAGAAGAAGAPPAPADAHLPLPAVEGSAGTATGVVLRVIQVVSAALSIAAMATAKDFSTIPSFIFLVVAAGVHTLWSFGVAVFDLDVMLNIKKEASQNNRFLHVIKFGNTIVAAVTFCAASAASGVLLFVRYDLRSCSTQDCQKFEDAITRAFISFAATVPCALADWIRTRTDRRRAGPGDEEAMFSLTDFIICTLNMLGIGFAAPSIGIGLMMSCHDRTRNIICSPSMPLELLIIALIGQMSASAIEVVVLLLAMCCWVTTLTGPPLTCLLLVTGKWVMSLWSLGTACATLGLMWVFFDNHSFDTSTN